MSSHLSPFPALCYFSGLFPRYLSLLFFMGTDHVHLSDDRRFVESRAAELHFEDGEEYFRQA